MNTNQIENIYKANGLKDYILLSTEDILRVHGIDFRVVDGYNRLDDINKKIYSKFIINIFNAFNIESRTSLIPRGIYYVEDIEYLVKENTDDYFTIVGGIVNAIDKNGIKTVLNERTYERYIGFEITKSEPEFYLRFEYEHDGRNTWLHVLKENIWY